MSGVSQDKLYYLLVPVHNKGSRIFVPVGGKAEELRFVVTPEAVEQIMEKLPEMAFSLGCERKEIKEKIVEMF